MGSKNPKFLPKVVVLPFTGVGFLFQKKWPLISVFASNKVGIFNAGRGSFLAQPQTVEPEDTPVPQNTPHATELLATTLLRTSAVRQLAAQMNSPQGLVDPAHSVMRELTRTTHEIHIARAAAAVAAETMTTTDSWTCVLCLVEYSDLDSVSVSRCHHHYHTNCISCWSENRRSAHFPYVDCPRCRDRLQVTSVERFC